MSITSVVNLVAGKIGELLVEEAKFLYGVEGQVRSLQEEFEMMQSFLKDMEAMGEEEGGDERSRTTIKKIREIAYDAEDVVESYIVEASLSTDQKQDFLRRYLCFCTTVLHTHQVGSEIKAIKERLDETMIRWKKYMGEMGVRVDARQGLNKIQIGMRLSAYPHTHEDHVIGLEEDINKLIGVLTDREHTEIKIVTMVGMGGSGKTTLARKLYNHDSVKKHFDCLVWVSVSQAWDAKQIILDMWKKVKGETMTVDECDQVLVGKLYEYLKMKSYLIVLDDVWQSEALRAIRPSLPIEGHRGKIIVTTRKQDVANYPDLMPFTYSHTPRRLTKEESWELFNKIALIHRGEEIDNSMKELGKEMLKKCGGLPLAVIALSGILFDKEHLEEWDKISKTISSRIMEEGRGTQLYGPVNQMLALSYLDLPSHLKPCILYLARYPEDHLIRVGELVRMWIAEGFITSEQAHEGGILEDIARRYLDELVHRCLVLVVGRNYEGKVNRIQIHDLVRDQCIRKAKDEDFLEVFTPEAPNSKQTKSRRAIIYSQSSNLLPFPTDSAHLHSLIYEAKFGRVVEGMNLHVIPQKFRLLRVLILVGNYACVHTLPIEIGNLILLRYLGLGRINIAMLPTSIGNLRNLLTLNIQDIHQVDGLRIPDVLWKLERLVHLSLPRYGESIDTEQTLKLHTLKFLKTLKVGVAKHGGRWISEEFPRLSPILEKLHIGGITRQEQLDAVFQCPSMRSNQLHSLRLEWETGESMLQNLEPIIRCQHLRKLYLRGRMGDGASIQFPDSIIKLVLEDTRFDTETTLLALGKLPHLTYMSLDSDAYMGSQWTCSVGHFPHLKQLHMILLENLEEWRIEKGAMPQLMELEIGSCMKLKKLPEGLKFISTLESLEISGSSYELKERMKAGGEDANIIGHVPHVNLE